MGPLLYASTTSQEYKENINVALITKVTTFSSQ